MEYNIYKNRRNYGDSPVYLNPNGFLAGNPATLVVGGSVYVLWVVWICERTPASRGGKLLLQRSVHQIDMVAEEEAYFAKC